MGFFSNFIGGVKSGFSNVVGTVKNAAKAVGHAANFVADHKDIISSTMTLAGMGLIATGVGSVAGAGLIAAGGALDKTGLAYDVYRGKESIGMAGVKLAASEALKYAKAPVQVGATALKFASSLGKETGVL